MLHVKIKSTNKHIIKSTNNDIMNLAGKHAFGSIGETRVTFIEKKISENRLAFLKKLLEYNGFKTIVDELKQKTEDEPKQYNLGVTDMTFNPTIWVFERRLKTIDGKHYVTPNYWKQVSEEANPKYWKNN